MFQELNKVGYLSSRLLILVNPRKLIIPQFKLELEHVLGWLLRYVTKLRQVHVIYTV